MSAFVEQQIAMPMGVMWGAVPIEISRRPKCGDGRLAIPLMLASCLRGCIMSSLCGRPHLVFVLPALVTWPTSTSPDMAQQLALLDRLLERTPEGAKPVLHSDMGWQCQYAAWCGRLRDAGIVQSMSRKGNCIDNGATEQVFGHMKDEFFRGREWPDFESFRVGLDACVVHWSTRGRQVKLKGLTPEEFRSQSLVA